MFFEKFNVWDIFVFKRKDFIIDLSGKYYMLCKIGFDSNFCIEVKFFCLNIICDNFVYYRLFYFMWKDVLIILEFNIIVSKGV